MLCSRHLWRLVAFAAVLVFAAPASAETIIDEWLNVKAPPAPELKAVTVDPKTTALLMMDFVPQSCSQQRRPRCLATLPKAKAPVIVIGTGANGAVLYTASGAVLRGMKVIVPVDVVSDVNVYMEQYVAYHLMNAPNIAGNITLTRVDMMRF